MPLRRIVPSLYWKPISKTNEFDVQQSVQLAVEAYKNSDFGLLRRIISNTHSTQYLNQLKDDAVGQESGNLTAALERSATTGNVHKVLALILMTNSDLQSAFDLEGALIKAALYNHQDVINILLKDKNLKSKIFKNKRKLIKDNKDLNTALTLACESGKTFDVVSILLTSPKIDLSANNNMALKSAIVYNHKSISNLLLSREKVRNAYNQNLVNLKESKNLDSLLIEACKSGDLDLFMDVIISETADASKNGNQLLLYAFKYGQDKMARILLENDKVRHSLLKTSQTILNDNDESFDNVYLEACKTGLSEHVLAMIINSSLGGLSYEDISKGILISYRNHQFDTARIISRLNGGFRKDLKSNSKLESYCRSGDINGLVDILASGYVDAAFDSNRALQIAVAAGQKEIAELLMLDKSVTDLAERVKNESLEKNGWDGVQAILSACGSPIQNSSQVVSLLLLDQSDPSEFADAALFNALKYSNLESFNILFECEKVSTYLRNVFSKLIDDFHKQNSLKNMDLFLWSFFKSEHIGIVFAIIRHFYVENKIESDKYSAEFIAKGLLRMDKDILSVLIKIPVLQEYLDKAISVAYRDGNAETKIQAFENSCQNGDIIAVCYFLLSSDFYPTINGLVQAVIHMNREIVDVLLQNNHILNIILAKKERLIDEAHGDKQMALRRAYHSENGIVDTLCLTLIEDPRIDPTENENDAIRTALKSGKLEIFMVLAYNQHVADRFIRLRNQIIQANQGDKENALIESCRNGQDKEFIAIILIDGIRERLDLSFNNNLALRTAYRYGHDRFAQALLIFGKVQLKKISQQKKLIKNNNGWNEALNIASRHGRFDDVVILTVGCKKYYNLANALMNAATFDNIDIVNLLRRMIPFNSRLESFKLVSTNGKVRPVGIFQMVRRRYILNDGIYVMGRISIDDLKLSSYLKIRFINSVGQIEGFGDAHGPGPFKEFMAEIWQEALKPQHGLFSGTDDGHVIISPAAKLDSITCNIFYQLGRILGKALQNGISLDIPFSPFVYTKLLKEDHDFEEFKCLDATLFKNLEWLQNYNGNVEELGLTFSINEQNSESSVTRIDLYPNGSNIPVNKSNINEYINQVFQYKMYTKSVCQYRHLVQGFQTIISKTHARLFSPLELKALMYGDNQYFELSDLKPFVKFYFCGGNSTDLENNFWQGLEELTAQERNDFLYFVTSSSRPPVGGFRYLDPPLRIEFVNSIPKTNLPRAMTCMNTLYMSVYYSQQDMQDKIKTMISLNDGFFFG